LQIGEEGLPDVAAEGEAGEFAFALDVDETRGFKLLHVMGERGGGDGKTLAEADASKRVWLRADALEHFHAARVADGFEDGEALGGRDGEGARGGTGCCGSVLGVAAHVSVSHG